MKYRLVKVAQGQIFQLVKRVSHNFDLTWVMPVWMPYFCGSFVKLRKMKKPDKTKGANVN
jgi:hypothetical protein